MDTKLGDIHNRPTTVRQSQTALIKTKPWEKPIGDIIGDIVIAAVKLAGIAFVLYLLSSFMSNGAI